MKKILIIGAGFLQSFVIRKAKALGYETLTVDGDPHAVGFALADKHEVISIVDEEACLAYARKERVDGVLTAATDYGVLTAAYIAREMHLGGLDYEVARLIKNKYKVRKRLFEARVDDTEQAFEINENTDLDAVCKALSFPVMVKPCDGSGSRGASRVDEASQLAAACKNAMAASITRRAEIETFIVGREYGAESLVVNGEIHVLGIMRKWMTAPPYYAELGHAMPTDLPAEVENRARQCVANAIKVLGIDFGSVNMDMLITAEGKIHIIDIGARMGGNMIGPCVIPYGTGVDYMANMIRHAVGDAVDLTPCRPCAVATRLLAFGDGVVRRLPDFERIEKEYEVEIYHHLALGQTVRAYHTNLDGCGYVVARAQDMETAIYKAETVLRLIQKTIFTTD
ncbi:MAG: ATP-grasp domain-containing protein [Ruminococcaceae bacterium]|nr:ATP-grasp domain-containing protein [Oscillospiraceae bacterium]